MSEELPQVEPTWPSGQPSITPAGEQAGEQPVAAQAVQVVPTSGYAVAALILSICSWLVCPIVPAIVGLVMASMADKEIRTGNAAGGGMSTAAKIISWINIGVFLAALVLGGIVLLIILIADASGGAA